MLFTEITFDPLNLFLQSDRAAMLDEIIDYVKFLRLQVKVKHSSLLFKVVII